MWSKMMVCLVVSAVSGCYSTKKNINVYGALSQASQDERGRDRIEGRCVFFGIGRALLDCILEDTEGQRLRALFETKLHKDGADVTPTIIEDRRISGEGLYIVNFFLRSNGSRPRGSASLGVPKSLMGDVFRGDPSRGGGILIKDADIRIHRELLWGRPGDFSQDGLFFALQEGSVVWAVPLGSDQPIAYRPLKLRMTDRLPMESLSMLANGAIIFLQGTITQKHVQINFHAGHPRGKSAPPEHRKYEAEIIGQ